MPKPNQGREFEIVVWGATGYTGKLVADYLKGAPSAQGLRWAIAGRDRGKLEACHANLGLASQVSILTGEAHDPRTLDEICERTNVICSTVGPFARHGSELVAACVRSGTHYCDISGETAWVRHMIDAHHEVAAQRGVRIVHCCGFDSIPSDLGVLLLADTLRTRGHELARADSIVSLRGGQSGSTLATLISSIEDAVRDPNVRRLLSDPYSLVPEGRGPDRNDMRPPYYEPRLRRWTAPFMMAAINAPIVRRSNALLAYPYGRNFQYSERANAGRSFGGLATALAQTARMAAGALALALPATRSAALKRIPKPGEGPTPEERAAGRFTVKLLGQAAPKGRPPANVPTLLATVSDRRDPGYCSTSVMVSESALSLARGTTTGRAGVLTPAAAFGLPLVERLKAAGQTWDVRDFSHSASDYGHA